MATISSLHVELKLMADNFNNGLKKAQAESKAFEKTIRPSLQLVQDLGAISAVAGGAIVGSMLAASKAAIDYGDVLNDARQRTGASVETLAKLGFAAEQSGSSFEGLSTGLKFLAKNMEAAIDKTGAQRKAFNELGINVADLTAAHGDVNQIMLLTADRFAGMEDGAEKTALAMAIFGRSGADLIPMLNEGSIGLTKLGDDAQRAGLVMSREVAEASDKLNDTLNELKRSALGLSTNIATALLPKLQDAANYARDGVQAFSDFTKGHQELSKAALGLGGLLGGVGGALTIIGIGVPAASKGFGVLQTGLGLVGIALTGVEAAAILAAAAVGVITGSLANWAMEGTRVQKWIDAFMNNKSFHFGLKAISDAQQSAAFTAKALADNSWGLKGVSDLLLPTAKNVKIVTDEEREAWEKARIAALKLKDEAAQLWFALRAGADLEIPLSKTFGQFGEFGIMLPPIVARLGEITTKVEENVDLLGDFARVRQSVNKLQTEGLVLDTKRVLEEQRGTAATMAALKKEAEARDKAFQDVKRSAGAMFDAMVLKGESVFTSFRNMLKGGYLSLGRAIFEDVTAALLGPIKQAFDTFFGALLESTGIKTLMTGLGNKIGGVIVNSVGGTQSAAGGAGSLASSVASSTAGSTSAIMSGGLTALGAGVGSAIGSFVGTMRLEGTMNAVEFNTRATYIELRDTMNYILWPMHRYLQQIAEGGGMQAAGGGGGGGGVNVNMTINGNVIGIDDLGLQMATRLPEIIRRAGLSGQWKDLSA